MPIDAGSLDRRIQLMSGNPTQDDHGDDVVTYGPLAIVWASVRPAPGSERLQSGENAASAPTVFRIRYSRQIADISAKDQIEYPVNSRRFFDIKSVVEIGLREGLEIAAIGRADQ